MRKTNYLLLLSIIFMLLMASLEKNDAVRPKGATGTHSASGTRNTNGATGAASPASTKLN
ncbi:hypothetical protein ACPPVU_17625 [Mucilaginibacter sp. McL0603]|uniref:hypothetical protein n=1 Tax=Mucilaginibacter sp. McL0603 TaxID=3415670 RepID=UPI003CE8FDD2